MKSMMSVFVKTILQWIQIIKNSPNHEIPIEHHQMNQIWNQVLSVKMGEPFQHLIQILIQP